MGQLLQVNGDYNIKCAAGGTITLDSGPGVGNVVITGSLSVEGEFLTVDVTNLDIQDNIILLNRGEEGAGVSLGYSGIEIDRGTETNATFLWDEGNDTFLLALGSGASLNFSDSNIRLRRIYTDASTDSGDLTLIATGTGVVKVFGTANYEDQVTHDDDIPNKKYVDDAIQNNPTFQIVSNDSRVIVTDKDIAGSLDYVIDNGITNTFGESAVSFLVDGELRAQFTTGKILLGNLGYGLEIIGTEITTENSLTNENISIRTQGTGKLQTNYALQLEKIGVSPSYVSGNTLLYAAEPNIGTTGVWFVNDSLEEAKRTGELISKNKALVFSMLF